MKKTKYLIHLLLALSLLGCAANRYELYMQLPEHEKELFDRCKQFMTDRQQEKYLRLPDSKARAEMIEGLHIQDRLAKFEVYIRDAIMTQQIVPGMSAEAVMLSWGKPYEIERKQVDGVPAACWYYERPNKDGKIVEMKVYFFKGLVTEVAE
jgi:hypothetical protein